MTIALRYQGRLTFDISRFFHTDQRCPKTWTTGAMLASNCPGSMAFPPDVLSHSGGHVRTGVASFLPRKVVCEGRPYLPACWKPVLRGCRAGGSFRWRCIFRAGAERGATGLDGVSGSTHPSRRG